MLILALAAVPLICGFVVQVNEAFCSGPAGLPHLQFKIKEAGGEVAVAYIKMGGQDAGRIW
jgi:hypothetical protein